MDRQEKRNIGTHEKAYKRISLWNFLGVAWKVPKSIQKIQFRQPNPFEIAKFSHASDDASIVTPLFDMDIDAQVSYQGEHVLLFYLMSRLNGMAITGYPMIVETLEHNSSLEATIVRSWD